MPPRTRDVPMLDTRSELAEIREEVDVAIARVLDSGQYVLGPEVEAFETEAAAVLGVRHAVALNSGTDALLIALRAAGVGPGDEVVTTAFSFFATSEVVLLLGAVPVFVDVDPDRLLVDPRLVADAIGERTKAVLPVHLYGDGAPVAELAAIAERSGVAVIEDAAQAFGAPYTDAGGATPRALGTFGLAGAFSFYPTKNLGAFGDGGMLVTDDDDLAASARALRNHGGVRRYEHETAGYNSRLDAIQAAALRVKLPRLPGWTAARRAIAARYDAALAGVEAVRTPPSSATHVYHQYTVRLPAGLRDEVAGSMRERGVATMVYYPTTLERYGGRVHGTLEHAHAAARTVLSLPIYPTLGTERQDRVIEALLDGLAGNERLDGLEEPLGAAAVRNPGG